MRYVVMATLRTRLYILFILTVSLRIGSALICRAPSIDNGDYNLQEPSSVVSSLSTSGVDDGSRVNVSAICATGMVSGPSIISECINGTWSPPWPTCGSALVCRAPSIHNGDYSVQGRSSVVSSLWTSGVGDGSRVHVSARCVRGTVSGPSIRSECINGTWTPPWPTCERERVPCDVPWTQGAVYQFINGSAVRDVRDYEGSTLPDGTWLVARCQDPGKYRLHGNSRRECVQGEWSAPAPTCEWIATRVLFAGLPRDVASNGTVFVYPRPSAAQYRLLKIRCEPLSEFGGTPQISAPHIPNVQKHYQRGRRVWSSYVHQYILFNPLEASHSGNFTCSTDRHNSPSHTVEVIMKELTCPTPVAPANGTFLDRDRSWLHGKYPISKKIHFVCNSGYRLVGASQVICTVDGWSKPTPICNPTRCREISTPANARMIGVYGYGRNIGDERVFYCNAGYFLRGSTDLLRCNEDGEWSAEMPTCERIRQTQVIRPTLCTRGDECESWEKCVITGPESYDCNCINPFNCETSGPQVCGTNGQNYTSECHLKALACLLDTGVDIADDSNVCIYGLPEESEYATDTGDPIEPLMWSQSFESSYSYDLPGVIDGRQGGSDATPDPM